MTAVTRALRDLLAGGVARPRTAIAVVVPLYNHAAYVGAGLRSLLAQTAAPREIVLLDDGSTDEGLAIARGLLEGVADCRVLSQPNAGAHAAINRAVALTDAPYVAVLNSDDLFAPDKLSRCDEIFRATPEAELIAGRVALMDARGTPVRRGPAAEWLKRAEGFVERSGNEQLALLHENFVATTSNMVFSRALWQRVGGFAPLRYCHDLDFLMRAYEHGRVVLDRARVHVRYRVHPANTIGEDVRRVEVERAAVVAATLCESGARLGDVSAFLTLLRANPRLADLVQDFVAQFPRFADRDAFLAFATG